MSSRSAPRGPGPLPGLVLLLSLLSPAAASAQEVVVEGVDGELLDNVRALLAIVRHADDLEGARLRRAHRQAPEEIRRALTPFGYYRPAITAALDAGDGHWTARYRIDPGPAMPLAGVALALEGPGRDDPALRRVMAEAPLAAGETVDHRRYEAFKQRWQRTAFEQGYLDARYRIHQLRVDMTAYAAEVELVLETGRQYRFGEVRFEGTTLKEELLRRYLPFAEGQPYSPRGLQELQIRLEDSGYFARVAVESDPGAADASGVVPVRVELEPRKRQRYTAGAGYGTDTGVRLRLGWEHRRINRAGHRLKASLEASEIAREFSGRYVVPVGDPRTDSLEYQAASLQENTDTSDSRTALLGVALTRGLGRWQRTLSLQYRRERFEVGNRDGESTLLVPGVSWTRVRADDRIYTRRGHRLSLELSGAAGPLLSDTSFAQARLDAKWVRALGEQARVLLRASLGSTWAERFEDLPPSLRFFAGGDQSVRGYGYHTLGPKDGDGDVIGGRHLVVGSVEYERRIHGPWGAAVFLDVGNALNRIGGGLARGAGVGLRWRSPVGLVRADVAVALSEPDRPVRLHLMIGPDL